MYGIPLVVIFVFIRSSEVKQGLVVHVRGINAENKIGRGHMFCDLVSISFAFLMIYAYVSVVVNCTCYPGNVRSLEGCEQCASAIRI